MSTTLIILETLVMFLFVYENYKLEKEVEYWKNKYFLDTNK